jgi:hypothetical protein
MTGVGCGDVADNCGNPGHWKVNCPLLAEAKKEKDASPTPPTTSSSPLPTRWVLPPDQQRPATSESERSKTSSLSAADSEDFNRDNLGSTPELFTPEWYHLRHILIIRAGILN